MIEFLCFKKIIYNPDGIFTWVPNLQIILFANMSYCICLLGFCFCFCFCFFVYYSINDSLMNLEILKFGSSSQRVVDYNLLIPNSLSSSTHIQINNLRVHSHLQTK
ncbi:hypothetical protein M0811_13915 [Anaeramoeba ignava]|uniref:Uncharacterized protein n=1 Tax=Anaeramoeba ignava TaxID=1746090 RepID=A0A9Q0LXV4_ANAIG|nr:hypothetical protein M0811_13915 [Anaeramoeba ignava]